jgi:hypothetical protein
VEQVPLISNTCAQFRERLRGDPALEVEEIGNALMPELIASVSHLPRETIVLPIHVRDRAGKQLFCHAMFSLRSQLHLQSLSMRFQTLIWERARLVDTLSA